MNIMIVDDTAFMRTLLRNMVEKLGLNVIAEASNGDEAVKKYLAYKPDLTLMDMKMPLVDGIEALKIIKEKDHHAKVIMCSAIGQVDLVLEAIENGALDYILKPVQEKRALTALQKALAM